MKINILLKNFSKLKDDLRFFLPRIGLSLFVILVLLVLFELTLRIYSARKPPVIFKISDSQIGYKLNPNYQGVFDDIFVKINSQGFRQNNEVQLIKPANSIRIVGLGDSVGFGYGLEEDKTYLRRLEEILNTSFPKKYEVVNAAVTGSNTFQERKLLEEELLKFKPDLIILSFVLNDIAGDFHMPNMVYRTLSPFKGGAYSPEDLNFWEKWFYFLFRKTYIYQFLHPKLKNFWGFEDVRKNLLGHYDKRTLSFYATGFYPQKRYSGAVNQVKDDLLKIDKLAKENGIDLVIIIFPVEIQLTDKALRKPQEIILNFCQEKSLKCLDLIPVLEKEKQAVFLDIGHPNAYSSEIIAQAIFNYLVKNNIINEQ